jgi:hypothetical protein
MRCDRPILLIALCCLGLAGACSRDPREEPYAYYAKFSEALADGAIQRGWLPEWVPPSASEIHLQVNLDTNRQCLRFNLPSADLPSLRGEFAPMSQAEIEDLNAECDFDPGWWFEGLIQQQPANDAALYADLYRASVSRAGLQLVIAIDRTGSAVYVWTP